MVRSVNEKEKFNGALKITGGFFNFIAPIIMILGYEPVRKIHL